MLATNIAQAISVQVGRELFNAAQYLSYASDAYALGLVATAKYLRKQAASEREHADGLVDYLDQRGAPVAIPAVPAPASAPDMTTMATSLLALEEQTTADLTAIQLLAEAAQDRQTYEFVRGYIAEQTEEEDSARKLARFVAISGDLATLDQQVALGLG